MTLVIGTDEAGYGPNLGPLVVAASAWRVTDADDGAAVGRLARAAERVAARVGGPPWLDSKRIYSSGGPLAPLETGVLAAIAACGATPGDGAALCARLGIATEGSPAEWSGFLAMPVPADADGAAIGRLAADAAGELAGAGVELVGLAARVVHPAGFNALLDRGLNKSDILSRTTLELAAGMRSADPLTLLWCDRHGGRKCYAPLLGRHFDAPLVRTLAEGPASSRYRIEGTAGGRVDAEFAVGGESRLPVALASMTAKYVRELAMRAFNAHWSRGQPELRPTAGYPVDARRWIADAAARLRAAGVPRDAVWRRA